MSFGSTCQTKTTCAQKLETDLCFPKLLSKHFPAQRALPKLFKQRNTKVNCSCMNSMASIIKSHNSKVLATNVPATVGQMRNAHALDDRYVPRQLGIQSHSHQCRDPRSKALTTSANGKIIQNSLQQPQNVI